MSTRVNPGRAASDKYNLMSIKNFNQTKKNLIILTF